MRMLGKTNLSVRPIGLGGIPLQRIHQKQVNQILESMIDYRCNFIDTARMYGASEVLIGKAMLGKRNHFIVATKSVARSYEKMKFDIDTSLTNLQTNYIDLYQCHNVKKGENYDGALQALLEAKNEGKIHHIGITSHSIEVLDEALDVEIFETIQYPYNFIETQAENLFAKAKRKNVGVIVMKPLAGGIIDRGDIALKFILNNDCVSVAIPGMASIEELKINATAASGPLTAEEWEYIHHLRATVENEFCRRCGYCLPCTVGIDIPMAFIAEGYALRYHLSDWGKERYDSLRVKADACIECGKCEARCPYHLPIIAKLKRVKETFKNGI